MALTFAAIYENGVLTQGDDLADLFDPKEWVTAKRDQVTLAEVRAALASIPGSLADAVIAARQDR